MRKDRFISGFVAKFVALFFAFAFVILGLCFGASKGNEVLASDSSVSTFQVKQLNIASYTSKDSDGNIVRTAPKPDITSDYKDWIFAGWYKDEACKSSVGKSVETGTYYAKFVPSEVLSAKCQVSAETDEESETSKLRIISTVDSLKYSKVGFDITFKGKTIEYSTNKVFSRIEAATEGVEYGYSPNIFDLQSEYFITATLVNLKNEDFGEGVLIKPYWVTKDGTKVYGVSRYARVEDSYLGIVNVPVRLYSDATADSATATVAYDASLLEYQETYSSTLIAGVASTNGYDVGYVLDTISEVKNVVTDTEGTITVTGVSDAAELADGMLVNLRLKIKDDVTLPKKNTFNVATNLENVVAPHVVYMNFYMDAYSGVADTTWFDKAQTEFVITTPEELYGLASLVNEEKFTTQTVYLGADITAIDGDASSWGTTPPSTNEWPRIANADATKEKLAFAGTFDGQGHTIRGIYVNDSNGSGYAGFFGQASGTIKNFSLENSYIASKGNMVGSIVGFLTGSLEEVSSKADVINSAETNKDKLFETGGLVGRFGSGSEKTISNCLFEGSVTSNNRYLGGLVGRIAMGTKTVIHCLNTGSVHTTFNEGAYAGGLIGSVHALNETPTSCVLEDSLNVGTVTRDNDVSLIGSVIGRIVGETPVTITNTYATNESYSTAIGLGTVTTGGAERCAKESLTGYTGYLKADLDFYTDNNKKSGGYWVADTDGTPMLKSFADNWADVGWYIDDDDITTYEISTVEELYGLAALSTYYNFEGETIKLTADITVNEGHAEDWGSVSPKNTWTPINASKSLPFAGTFDGQGHTISGIYVNKEGTVESEAFAGLFGATSADATIKNLRLENSYIYGTGYFAGSIAGRGNGTFDSVYSDAIVISDSGVVGGLAGHVNETTNMKNCWFAGTVNKSNTGFDAGGLVGATGGTLTVENCLNTGAITGKTEVGGLVGRVRSNSTLISTNSVNTGTVNSTETAGNILGENIATAKIANNYGLNAYSIIGIGTGTEWGNATYDKTAMQGNAAFSLKGLDYENYWVAKENTTPELKSFASSKGMLTPSGMQSYIGWYNSWDSEYTITTAAGLYGLSELSQKSECNNFLNKTVKLGADVSINVLADGETANDLKNKSNVNTWTPIGTSLMWGGTFDGQGHTIRGLYVNITGISNSYAGLFGQTTGRSTIRNLRLEDSYIYGSGYIVGGIAGRGNGMFDSIYSNATVKSDQTVVGGFIGQVNSAATITNCWYAGEVTASSEVGGFVGATSGTVTLRIENSYNSNKVNGSSLAGGLVGQVRKDGTLFASSNLNVGMFSGTSNVGNIVGKNSGTATIVNSYGLTDYAIGNGTITEFNNKKYAKTAIQGEEAFALKGLDFTECWVAKQNATPEIRKFSSKEGVLPTPKMQVYTGWYDGSNGTYTITTAAGLRGLSELSVDYNFAGSTICLGADITLNEGKLNPKGKESDWEATIVNWNQWTPIGSSDKLFNGIFDGQGHTIRGIYTTDNLSANTDGNNSHAGLFGVTNTSAKIQNLRLEDSYIEGKGYYVGSIAGQSAGTTFSNIYSSAIVKGHSAMTGGLVGAVQANGGSFTNCWYDGRMPLPSTGWQAGGIVGCVRNGNAVETTLTNCLNTAEISSARTGGDHYIGGLVGEVRIGTPKLTIRNSLNVGTISVEANPVGVGELVGYMLVGTLDMDATVYGIKGDWDALGSQSASVTSVTNTASLVDKTSLIGDSAKTTAAVLFEDEATWTTVIDGTPVLKEFAEDVEIVADTSWYDAGKKTFTIATAAELFGLSELSKTTNFANKTIKLGADITTNIGTAANWATEAPINKWTPIVEFAGTFDGQGYTISGIYVNDTDGNAGLFATTTVDSTVENLQLKNSYIYSSGANVGSIAGTGLGIFETIYSNATVEASYYYVGGIVGYVCAGDANKISNTWFDGDVVLRTASGYYAGGILGNVEKSGTAVTIENCLSSGYISSERTNSNGPSSAIGGLCGSAYSSGSTLIIKNSMHTGTFSVANTAGVGIAVGHIPSGTVKVYGTYGLTGDFSGFGTGNAVTSAVGSVELVDATAIEGEGAFTMIGLDFTDYWVAKESTLPELRSFTVDSGNLTAPATQVYTGWYDGSGEYTITTAAGLYGFAQLSNNNNFADETVKLGANIVLNEGELDPKGEKTDWDAVVTNWNQWTPIGYSKTYAGTFDGQGHTISGMYVQSSKSGVGLFRDTSIDSTIRSLRLENSYIISTHDHTGSIAGWGYGTIDSVYSDVIIVASTTNVGGLVGVKASTETKISNCCYAGTINATGSSQCVGGILGLLNTTSGVLVMENCLITGSVNSTNSSGAVNIGGFCGSALGLLEVQNSFMAGTVSKITTDDAAYIGTVLGNKGSNAVVRYNAVYSLSNDYSDTGYNTATGSVEKVGSDDIVGEGAFAMIGLDFTDYWVAKESSLPELRSFTADSGNLTAPATQVYTGWYNTWDSEFTITTKAGFYGFNQLAESASYYSGKIVKLGADIVMNEGTLEPDGDATEWEKVIANWDKWTPMDLKGTFDGQGHTISGLYVSHTSTGSGIFNDATETSTVKDLRLINSYITGTGQHVGSIAGWGYGNFESIYSNAIVVANSKYVGGLVGTNNKSNTNKISNCWFDGTIQAGTGSSSIGGLVGYINQNTSTYAFENCLSTGTINSAITSDANVGGLCGEVHTNATLNVANSLVVGTITVQSTTGVGKVVGKNSGTVTLTNVYSLTSDYSDIGTGTATETVSTVAKSELLGENATTNASALFTDGTTWTTITNGIPVLTSFKEYGVVESDETLLGVPVSKYRIVISEDATTLMELLAGYLQTKIAEQTSFTLEVVDDATKASHYEIVLGNTSRTASDQLYVDGKYQVTDYSYAIKSVDGSISVGYTDSPALVDAFTKLLDVIANDEDTSIDVTSKYDMSDVEKAEDSYIRVMSSNIYNSQDPAFNNKIPYQARAELLAECYLRYKPDFIGWQEADQVLRGEVYKYIADEYQMIEFEMTGNNWCPIFYRKDLYNLETADYYRLDSAHYCEWALYSSKSNPEEQFIHMNIHYNVTESTALKQAVIVNKVIKKLMAEYPDVPMAITGDYNFTVSESVFKIMMRGIDDQVQSGSQILKNEDSKYYTWHSLGKLELSETYVSSTVSQQGPIDHVSITTKLLEAKEYKIIHDSLTCWAADHYPIFLDVAVK